MGFLVKFNSYWIRANNVLLIWEDFNKYPKSWNFTFFSFFAFLAWVFENFAWSFGKFAIVLQTNVEFLKNFGDLIKNQGENAKLKITKFHDFGCFLMSAQISLKLFAHTQ